MFFDKYTPFYAVVAGGFGAANLGIELASLVKHEKDKQEFKNECEIFSKTAKAIDELLDTTMEEREIWLQFKNN